MISQAWKAFLCLAIGVLLGHQALALTQNDAENALAKANNDFFNALVSGQAATPGQLEKVKADTVTQAQKNLDQVIEGSWHDALVNQAPALVDPSSLSDDLTWPGIKALLSGQGGRGSLPYYSTGQARSIDPSRIRAGVVRKPASLQGDSGSDSPQMALDGKAIPKYLEFRGRRKASPPR